MTYNFSRQKNAKFFVKYKLFASNILQDIERSEEQLADSDTEFVDKESVEQDLARFRLRMQLKGEVYLERYKNLKEYFTNKIASLAIENPLILFDDAALRIDIGYGPKELQSTFGDIGGILERELDLREKDFLKVYKSKEYQAQLKAESEGLLQLYRSYKAEASLKSSTLAKLDVNSGESSIIKGLLKGNDGFVIGERHEEKSPKQFLIDNMPLMKRHGVTTIYLEHLLYEVHQSLLDKYMSSPPEEPMPKNLERYLSYLDIERKLEGSASFTGIVKAAKSNGLRVIAIDTEASYQERDNRTECMNAIAVKRVQECQNGGKYVAFIGDSHASMYKKRYGDGLMGVPQLLGCPGIAVYQTQGEQKENIEINASYSYKYYDATLLFDAIYCRSPEHRSKNSSESIGFAGEKPKAIVQKPSANPKQYSVRNSPKFTEDKDYGVDSSGWKRFVMKNENSVAPDNNPSAFRARGEGFQEEIIKQKLVSNMSMAINKHVYKEHLPYIKDLLEINLLAAKNHGSISTLRLSHDRYEQVFSGFKSNNENNVDLKLLHESFSRVSAEFQKLNQHDKVLTGRTNGLRKDKNVESLGLRFKYFPIDLVKDVVGQVQGRNI